MADERELPKGRFARLTQLARVGARTGVALLGASDAASAAQMAVERLGNMRGLAAKVGQMASYIDGFLPADQSEPYARVEADYRAVHRQILEEQERARALSQTGAPVAPG
jgi:hypothetical protein